MGMATALVTGATGGLGRAVCARLAAQGFRLVLVARDEARVASLADDLAPDDHRERFLVETADLASADDIGELLTRVVSKGFAPDVLVNNAATQGPIGPFLASEWPAWQSTIAVDLFAPALLTRHLVPGMVERGWGRVINISGGGAAGPRPDFSAYAVAKTALVRLTETLAHELAGSGVTLNAVAPGPMNTRMLDEVIAAGPLGASREYAPAVARARDGGVPPDQAAALVAWLASPASDGVTGRLLSAVWDPWQDLDAHREEIAASDIYTLRRIVPRDRGHAWGDT